MFVPIIRRICIIASVLEADGVHLGNPFSEKKTGFWAQKKLTGTGELLERMK